MLRQCSMFMSNCCANECVGMWWLIEIDYLLRFNLSNRIFSKVKLNLSIKSSIEAWNLNDTFICDGTTVLLQTTNGFNAPWRASYLSWQEIFIAHTIVVKSKLYGFLMRNPIIDNIRTKKILSIKLKSLMGQYLHWK